VPDPVKRKEKDMFRLLIVDDEQIMRKAMRMIVGRYIPEIETIYEAESGRAALEIVDREKIHIVCMDIKMPGIDGIETIKQMKRKFTEATYIIISAFDEFETAAAAMELGVKRYLLKPLDREEFIRVLCEAIEEQKEQRRKNELELHLRESIAILNENMEKQTLYALMTGNEEEIARQPYAKYADLFRYGGSAFVIVFHTRDWDKLEWIVHVKKTDKKLRDFAAAGVGVAGQLLENKLVLFLGTRDPIPDRERWLQASAQAVCGLITAPEGMRVCVGVGCMADTMGQLNLSYCSASRNADRGGKAGVHVVYGDGTAKDHYRYPIHVETEVFQAILSGDAEIAMAKFSELFSYIVANANGGKEFIYRQLYMFAIGLTRLRVEKNIEDVGYMGLEYMSDTLSMYKWCVQNIEKSILDLNNRVVTYSDNLIEEAIAYIHENYHQQITLSDISGKVYLSSYYFTKLFKSKTGKTFVEYLTDYRIEIAKKLLKENAEYSIQDVCEMVGYNDKKYFCKCFKKSTGMTPAAYRDQIL